MVEDMIWHTVSMREKFVSGLQRNGRKTGVLVMLVFLLFAMCSLDSVAYLSTPRGKNVTNVKKTRPKGGEIVVRHADSVVYNELELPGVQVFIGHVEFYHDGTVLKCDSANFFKESNSFKAFDNVKMFQGDTLSLRCEYLFYDGNSQVAQARSQSHRGVVLRHGKSTLYTDSLDYDRLYNMGYFFEGGELIDGGDTLTSDWGQYDAHTKQAVFNYNVELKSDNYNMRTDTLYYNVVTKDAQTRGRSNVVNGQTQIYTENGVFNTETNKAVLLNRSVVVNVGSKMVADSIVFDKDNRVAEGFGDFVYNDEPNKTILTGDYCYYNDSTGHCLSYGKALVKNYSEPDTLFLHADTLKMQSYCLNTDSVYRIVSGFYHSRSFRTDVQSVADSLSFNSKTRVLSLYGNPVVWNGRQQIIGEEIHSFFNDSTIDSIQVINQALLCEKLDSLNFNQIAGKEMHMYFNNGQLGRCEVHQNVKANYFQLDDNVKDTVVVAMNHTETSVMKMYLENKKLRNVWTAESDGVFYPITFVTNNLRYLENFAWLDYMRPKDKDDLFVWRDKPADKVLKATKRREVPYQYLNKK